MPDYNRFGEIVTAVPSLRNEAWLIGFDAKGWPLVNWDENIKNGDENGFDLNCALEEFELPIGSRIMRYGKEQGLFSSPIGTKYECLALPYTIDSIMYNEYEVIRPLLVKRRRCAGYPIQKGIVAEGFGTVGGGIQYKHHEPILTSFKKHFLRKLEVSEWSINPETREACSKQTSSTR